MYAVLTLLMIALWASLLMNVTWYLARVLTQQRRPALTAATISTFMREWAAALWMIVGAPLGLLPHRPRPALSELSGHPPVLLVPGYGLTRAMMWPLAAYLRRRGRWVWAVNNPIFEDDIPTFAASLRDAAEELCRQSGADQIDIVGHSMGGIVAAWYIRHLGGDARVRRLVTLGTPWQGTLIHIIGLGRQSRALGPQSPIIADLQDFSFDTVAVWSKADCIVLHSQSAAPDHARTVELEGVGHIDMLANAKVMRAVRDALGPDEHEAVA
jgi:hypothetical protein